MSVTLPWNVTTTQRRSLVRATQRASLKRNAAIAARRGDFPSGLATVLTGILLALTITPLHYAAALIIADIVSIWTPLPPTFWQHANDVARYGMAALEWLTQGGTANPQALVIGAAVLLSLARFCPWRYGSV